MYRDAGFKYSVVRGGGQVAMILTTRYVAVACLLTVAGIQTTPSMGQMSLSGSHTPALMRGAGIPGVQSPGSSTSISVLTYGADPTCMKDSSAAINNAILAAAAAGKEVDFPAGCYAHDNVIRDTGVVLRGVGDQTEIRSTPVIAPYPVSSWSVDREGKFRLTLKGNEHIYAGGGSAMTVNGLSGYGGNCNPNGIQYPESATPTTIVFTPQSGRCTSGSGTSGRVANTAPNAAIMMSGSGAQLRNMKITTTWSGERVPDKYAVPVLNTASNFVMDHVHIVGSPTGGYDCLGCNNGSETNNIVENTNADGFYHAQCAFNIVSSNNQGIHTGDDTFSVNSYKRDPCICHDIAFQNDVSINSQRRGFEVGGGNNISYTGGSIVNANLACIFFQGGKSGSWDMSSATNLSATGITARGCGGPGVYIASTDPASPVTNVTISNVSVTVIANDALKLGDDNHGVTQGILITNSKFGAASGGHRGVLVAGASGITMNGISFNGFGKGCVFVARELGDPTPMTGTVNCDATTFSLQNALR